MSKTVVGFFESTEKAQSVKQALGSSGFESQNINVVAKGPLSRGDGYDGRTTEDDESIGEKISGFFRSLTGGEAEDERRYADGVRRGGAVVAVTVPDERAEQAAEFLERYGARDIDEQAASGDMMADTTGRMTTEVRGGAIADRGVQDQRAIPVIEERMELGKRGVQRGGVRVYTHETEQPFEANVSLREEHIHVDRRPADRPASQADYDALRSDTIELTETSEEVVVTKSARVVGEVVVGKETTERNQTVRDTLKRTEVEVEQMDAPGSARSFSDHEDHFRQDFETNYASQGGEYDQYAPAYEYGYRMATDPRYSSGDWSTIEPQVQSDWQRNGPGPWDKLKSAVRSGWLSARGR